MKKQEEQILVVDIHLTRGLVTLLTLALLAAVLLSYLTWGREEVAASDTQAPLAASTGLRQYYLTESTYNGANASTVCAGGYHMASLWEILDPSNLKYNTDLGNTSGDSGQGPPAWMNGWVRTGYGTTWSAPAGSANCLGWTTSEAAATGTVVRLSVDWTASQDIHIWEALALPCDQSWYVWCVED